MALQDHVMEETEDKKKAVKDYAHDMLNKLSDGEYHDFVTNSTRGKLIKLFSDEYYQLLDEKIEARDVYVAKLEKLKKQGDPIEERYKEHTKRGLLLDQLMQCINRYKEVASSNDPKFAHMDMAEKQKILDECVIAEAWMKEEKLQHEKLPKHAGPALLSAAVSKKMEALEGFCLPIMEGPKRRPAKRAKTDN